MPSIYLAGPMENVTKAAAQSWRCEVESALREEIVCFSPVRDKHRTTLYDNNDFRILRRDFHDVMRSDALLLFVNTNQSCYGSMIELGWAYQSQKPVIVVAPEYNAALFHPMVAAMIKSCGDYTTTDLAEGIQLARSILLP